MIADGPNGIGRKLLLLKFPSLSTRKVEGMSATEFHSVHALNEIHVHAIPDGRPGHLRPLLDRAAEH